MAPYIEQLLTNLFKALTLPGSAENEYIMKGKRLLCARWLSQTHSSSCSHGCHFFFVGEAIMRSFSLLQETIVPYIPTLIGQLTHKLLLVSKVKKALLGIGSICSSCVLNAWIKSFIVSLFRIPASLILITTCLSLCACLWGSPAKLTRRQSAALRKPSSPSSRRSFRMMFRVRSSSCQMSFSSSHGCVIFFPLFSFAEFLPYVFQVMSLLLEIHSNSIPSSYMALFPHLLQPVLWERTGNIPPLVRLLQAYLEKGGASIAASAADKIVRRVSVVSCHELGLHDVRKTCDISDPHCDLRCKNK